MIRLEGSITNPKLVGADELCVTKVVVYLNASNPENNSCIIYCRNLPISMDLDKIDYHKINEHVEEE